MTKTNIKIIYLTSDKSYEDYEKEIQDFIDSIDGRFHIEVKENYVLIDYIVENYEKK